MRLTAIAWDRNGHEIVGARVVWSSTDSAVATVSESGWVVARGNGAAGVVAASGVAADTASIDVAQVPVSLEVGPNPVRMGEGDTLRLEAVVRDANGVAIEGAAVAWKSTFAAAVSVDETGLVTGKMRGHGARVVAEAGALADSVIVRVMDQISVRANDGIYLMNEDGSNRRKITTKVGDVPVWSPDGRLMAYLVVDNGYKSIRIVDVAAGTDEFRTWADYPNNSQRMEWSAAGGWIAFDHKYPNAPDLPTRVVVIKAAGGGEHSVEDEYDNHSPTLSPDGKKVAYLSRRDGVFHLVTANVDGTGKRSIVSGPYHAAPAWSPWGDQIAFSKMDGGVWKVFVVNVDGTGLREIGPGYNPQWAPLGRRILAVTRDSPRDVYVYDLNAGTSETVISGGTFNGLPRWSPDGGRLLIATDAGSRINVFHLERREMEEVGTMHAWSDRSYTWRPREPLQIVPSF